MRLSRLDRLRAWLVTGPPGRALAFAADFAVALARFAGGRTGRRRRDRP